MTQTQTTTAASSGKMEPSYVLAPIGVFFLCCQLILCRVARFCPWSNHWLFTYAAEAGDFLPNVIGSMALGSIPKEPSAVALTLFLIVLNNSMAAYDREKVKLRYVWTGINVIWLAYRALNNAVRHAHLGSKGEYVGAYAIVATLLCVYAYCNIFIALASSCKQYSEAVVAEHTSRGSKDGRYDPSTLKGYGYVVLLEPKTITVDEILSPAETANAVAAGEEQGKQQEPEQEHKDVCLSFSLFQLLFCLYHGVPWYNEASVQKSRRLVLEGLLGRPPQLQLQQHEEEAHYNDLESTRRGFRVVEVELAFLHDHIHGGDILWFPGSAASRAVYYSLKLVMAVIMYFVGILYLTRDRPPVWVIAAPLLLYMLFGLLQVVFYCRSDRQVVSRICCHYCNDTCCLWQRHFAWFISLVRRPKLLNKSNGSKFYRLERVGQYSLLEEKQTATPQKRDNSNGSRSFPFPQTSLYSHNAKPSGSVPLPSSLKLRVAEVLGKTICEVPVPLQVEQAQQFQGAEPNQKISIILKWHIATSYCEMMLQQAEDDSHGCPSREVVAVLSKYCSYLVAFCPELLPCPVSVTMCIFCNVLEDVTSLMGGQQDRDHKLHMLRTRIVAPFERSDDILTPGLQLGHHLITEIQNHQDLWAILESIWVKLILSVAPQETMHDDTYAKRHAKYLARGGEFLTYLWAMLSHAGIQKHSSWPPFIRAGRVVPWANP